MNDLHLLIRAPEGSHDYWLHLCITEEVRRVLLFRRKIFEVSEVADESLTELRFADPIPTWWARDASSTVEALSVDEVTDSEKESFEASLYCLASGEPVPDEVLAVIGEHVVITKRGFWFTASEKGSSERIESWLIPWEFALDQTERKRGTVLQLFGPKN
jgi:hypothetical protein